MSKGKLLAYLLRHDKSYNFDKHGWRDVSDLINNHHYTFDEINEIVDTNNKHRFEFNNDKTKIRARQGHSINVDVELKEQIPPKFLYHGTAKKFLNSINKFGINKGNRLYVHLSKDYNTAIDVGKRHGDPVVITINAEQMNKDSYKFYLSNNGIWLTEYINTKYFIK